MSRLARQLLQLQSRSSRSESCSISPRNHHPVKPILWLYSLAPCSEELIWLREGVPIHCRMRGIDRDLIRGGHYGRPSCEPHPQAEHMAAPTSSATWRFSLPTPSRRHMARSRRLPRSNNSSAIRGDPEARGATLAPPLVTQCTVRPRILTINCQVTAATRGKGRGPSKGKHSSSARYAQLRQWPLGSGATNPIAPDDRDLGCFWPRQNRF